eukprot:4736321-Prymnesium_polylepis.1
MQVATSSCKHTVCSCKRDLLGDFARGSWYDSARAPPRGEGRTPPASDHQHLDQPQQHKSAHPNAAV